MGGGVCRFLPVVLSEGPGSSHLYWGGCGFLPLVVRGVQVPPTYTEGGCRFLPLVLREGAGSSQLYWGRMQVPPTWGRVQVPPTYTEGGCRLLPLVLREEVTPTCMGGGGGCRFLPLTLMGGGGTQTDVLSGGAGSSHLYWPEGRGRGGVGEEGRRLNWGGFVAQRKSTTAGLSGHVKSLMVPSLWWIDCT